MLPTVTWDGKLWGLASPHIGIAYLVSYIKAKGLPCSFDVLDISGNFRNRSELIKNKLATVKPDLIGISIFSSLASEARELIQDIKAMSNTPIVVGGPHISVVQEEFLKETKAEYGIMMDGEVPFYNMIRAIFIDNDMNALEAIPGLIYRNSRGKYTSQQNSNMIIDLDEIPFPDYSIFDLNEYPSFKLARLMLSSRGCPYGCTYCGVSLVTGKRFRKRSAINFVDEMEEYVKQGIKIFGVFDDAFNIDLIRAKEICHQILARKLNIQWELANGLRANTVDRELIQLLKLSGCTIIGFGLESGHPEILKKIKKGLTLEQMDKALRLAKEMGITAVVNLIIGHPDETYETARETLRVAERLPASYVNIYGLIPTKGTEAYEELRKKEATGSAIFFYDYDYYIRHLSSLGIDPVFETKEFTRQQRKQLLKKGRRITQKTAMKYRLGKAFGTIVYYVTLNRYIFNFCNNLRSTRYGMALYNRVRRKG